MGPKMEPTWAGMLALPPTDNTDVRIPWGSSPTERRQRLRFTVLYVGDEGISTGVPVPDGQLSPVLPNEPSASLP